MNIGVVEAITNTLHDRESYALACSGTGGFKSAKPYRFPRRPLAPIRRNEHDARRRPGFPLTDRRDRRRRRPLAQLRPHFPNLTAAPAAPRPARRRRRTLQPELQPPPSTTCARFSKTPPPDLTSPKTVFGHAAEEHRIAGGRFASLTACICAKAHCKNTRRCSAKRNYHRAAGAVASVLG